MKKSELEDENAKLSTAKINLAIELNNVKAQLMVAENKLEEVSFADEQKRQQLEKLSQSIYTLLQVKYPTEENSVGMHAMAQQVPYCTEDRRMLEFLHRLCSDTPVFHFSV